MLLSLRVPAGNERGPLYMDQALAAIHQANPDRHPVRFLLTGDGQAVHLFCSIPEPLRGIVEAQLYAQYPDATVKPMPESTFDPEEGKQVWSTELHLDPDLFPIKRYPQFADASNREVADPLTALLTVLARQKGEHLVSRIEITVRPASGKRTMRGRKCLRRLAAPFFRAHPTVAHWFVYLATSHRFPYRVIAWPLAKLGKHAPHHSSNDPLHTSGSRAHEREDHVQAASDKFGRLLFETHIRVLVTANPQDEHHALRRIRQIAGSFGVFHSPGMTSFRSSRIRRHRRQRHHVRAFPSLLSTEEVATIFHPPTASVRVPTITTVESRELPPPLTLPTVGTYPDVAVLGHAVFRGKRDRFGILPDDRRRHMLLLGKTGMGKSTLLHHLLSSDIRARRGFALIDPHGDLAEAALASIPSARTNDIILFDAGDAHHPVAFNVLACPRKEQRPLVASGVLSAFKKLYGESWGPRMEHILRNALLALLEVPGTSLVSILRLLHDAKYRSALVEKLSDPAVRAFWQSEFANMPPKLQLEAIAPIQNKVGHFVSSPLLRNIIGQGRSTLDLRHIMDDGRVLIVNLSKGRIGDDASTLLGSLLVTGLQLAAMSRANLPEEQRRDFFLFVDEFQNFATDSFATILSEARKYRLALTLSNQYLAQMSEQTLAAVFGNIGTLIAFQVGAQDAEIVAEQLGGDLQKQDLFTLPRYAAYVRLLIDGMPSRPFSMQTLPPSTLKRTPERPAIIRRYSRQRYGRPLATVEREIADVIAGR